MTKGFCVSNKLVQYVLRKVEADPDCVFTEVELTKVSKRDFDSLKKDKWLLWQQFNYDSGMFFSSIPGDQTTSRRLTQRKDGKYWADAEEAGIDRIVVEEKDIPHYKLDLSKFISQIAKKNSLEEEVSSVSDRLWFIGSKDVSGDRAGIFIALNDSDDELKKGLKGLPSSVSRYSRYIILSPFICIADQKTKNILDNIDVSQFNFDKAFENEFTFKSGFIFSESKAELPQTLYLTGRIESEKHIVAVDSKEGGLTDANFKLLLELVVALKTISEGWMATGEGEWQGFRRLKDDFKRSFNGFDFEKFIVNGRKRYRLVIPADGVTYDRAMLKKIKDNAVIADLAGKLPIIRKKQGLKS